MIAFTDAERKEYRNIWVVAEILSGEIQPVTHELAGAARTLADLRKSEVWIVVIGSGIEGKPESLFAYGADVAILVDNPGLSGFVDETETKIMKRLIVKYKPEVVICGATTRGRALIPRVAVMTNCGLTADCTGLSIDYENGDLLQTRPAFGGNIMAHYPLFKPQTSDGDRTAKSHEITGTRSCSYRKNYKRRDAYK